MKLLTALLPRNPTVLGTEKSGSMYEIKNIEVIMNNLSEARLTTHTKQENNLKVENHSPKPWSFKKST